MQYQDIFTKHFGVITLQFIILQIVALILALAIEYVFVEKHVSTLYRLTKKNLSRSLKQDIIIWILDLLGIWSFIGKLITFGITYYIAMIVNQWITIHSYVKFLPHIYLPLQILLSLLFADFTGYWLHRIFHQTSSLWRLHKFHHSATDFFVFTARRDNPLVVPLFILFTGLPLSVFGFPIEIPLWVTFLAVFHAQIIHSQIQSDWGFFGRWLLVSPYMHRVHHSKSKLQHTNFAFMFPIWDHVFGTYHHSDDIISKLGIGGNQNMGMLKEISNDISSFIRLSLNSLLSVIHIPRLMK